MEPSSNKKTGIIVSVLVVLGVIAASVFAAKKDSIDTAMVTDTTQPSTIVTDENTVTPTKETASVKTSTQTTTTPPKTPVVATSVSVYKNGTYSAVGSYMSPGGMDKLNVSLTLKDDIVTDATVTAAAGDNTSEKYQAKFIAGYKTYVIGKNINDINLTKVSGASLTPIGFNDAVAQIKVKATV